MSLTLEEKQRLAKEQEQAAKLRSQQPLAPQAVTPASGTNTKVTPAFHLVCIWKHWKTQIYLRFPVKMSEKVVVVKLHLSKTSFT